jgi:hypothetical protein
MFADVLSARGFGWFPMALATGLVLGATACTVLVLALCAWFPFLHIALPIASLAIALPLCMAGAVGSIAAIARGRRVGETGTAAERQRAVAGGDAVARTQLRWRRDAGHGGA